MRSVNRQAPERSSTEGTSAAGIPHGPEPLGSTPGGWMTLICRVALGHGIPEHP